MFSRLLCLSVLPLLLFCCIFFFKQKTSYEVRISDWSSDVCSSDLVDLRLAAQFEKNSPEQNRADARFAQFQLAIDKRVATATERGASKEQLAQIVESAKVHVAATLREGKSPTQEIGRAHV